MAHVHRHTAPPSIFKSASAGVLRPMNVRGLVEASSEDPVQVVLNRAWSRSRLPAEDGTRLHPETARSRPHSGSRCKAVDLALSRTRKGGLYIDTKTPTGSVLSHEVDSAHSATTSGVSFRSADASPLAVGDSPGFPALPAREPSPQSQLERRYTLDLAKGLDGDEEPPLRSPPRNLQNRTFRLVFTQEEAGAQALNTSPADMQRVFLDLTSKLHTLVSQTCVRMNDLLLMIRGRFNEDPQFLSAAHNHEHLSEILFLAVTANYYLSKWHRQLEPRSCQHARIPSRLVDPSPEDLLANLQGAVSRMELLVGKLAPTLWRIVHDARSLRRQPNGEPVTPTSRNPLRLAQKRGLQDVQEVHGIISHLERLLFTTQALAQKSGASRRSSVSSVSSVLVAVSKFKRHARSSARSLSGSPVDRGRGPRLDRCGSLGSRAEAGGDVRVSGRGEARERFGVPDDVA